MNLTKNKGAANSFVQALDVAALVPATPDAPVVAILTSMISLSDLWVGPEYQVTRDYPGGQTHDPAWAAELAHLLEDDKKELEPVDVFVLDGRSVLVHGYNRFGAYQLAGRMVIPAIVHPGGPKEAMELALRANARPSKPQSASDKEKRVRLALVHFQKEGPVADREIARRLDGAVSHTFVGNVRRKVDAEVAAEAIERGEAPPEKPEFITAQRANGQPYQMKTTGLKNRSHKLQKATSVPAVQPPSLKAAPPAIPAAVAPPPTPLWQVLTHPEARLDQPVVDPGAAESEPVVGSLCLTVEQAQLLRRLLDPEDSYAACGLKE